MKRLLVAITTILLTLVVTGCDKTPINLFDHAHKPAVEFVEPDEQGEVIDYILNN